MLVFSPHSANPFRAATPNSDDYATLGLTVSGLLEPISADAVLREYGLDLVTASEWYMNTGDAYNPQVGDRLLVDGAYWEIKTEPIRYTSIFFLSHQKMACVRVGDYS